MESPHSTWLLTRLDTRPESQKPNKNILYLIWNDFEKRLVRVLWFSLSWNRVANRKNFTKSDVAFRNVQIGQCKIFYSNPRHRLNSTHTLWPSRQEEEWRSILKCDFEDINESMFIIVRQLWTIHRSALRTNTTHRFFMTKAITKALFPKTNTSPPCTTPWTQSNTKVYSRQRNKREEKGSENGNLLHGNRHESPKCRETTTLRRHEPSATTLNCSYYCFSSLEWRKTITLWLHGTSGMTQTTVEGLF